MPLNLDSSLASKIMPISAYKDAAANQDIKQRQGEQSIEASDQNMKAQKVKESLALATPENWQEIRPMLVQEGVPENLIPPEFNEGWQRKILTGMGAKAETSPSSVREYEYFNQLPEAEKDAYLNMKRADKVVNMGGSQAVLAPRGGIKESYEVTPKPQQAPTGFDFKDDGGVAPLAGSPQALEYEKSVKDRDKAMRLKNSALTLVTELLKNEEGVRSNFGVYDQYSPNVTESTRDAANKIQQLRDILTSDNLGIMSGVLSETDLKVIQGISGGFLAEGATEEGVIDGLKKYKESLRGEVAPTLGNAITVPPMPVNTTSDALPAQLPTQRRWKVVQ